LLTGIDVVELPLSTGKPETDYPLWSETAVKKIKDFDGLYIHIKGPDEPAHDGNFNKKKESIEAIDKFFFGSLIPKINLQDYIIAVTADHSTPCKLKSHSADPVPLLVVGGTIKPDGSLSFSEKAAKLGSIGELTGQDILPFIVKHASQ
ncbi:MAG TPA: phosphoglycerate mutase, partial [Candidatus Omnitrophica bacterium]|nr:phosphoglycerate mutase [Candidatus Omnitrophota bacterium]